jgi:Zn-finger nucleic acid-binding protein
VWLDRGELDKIIERTLSTAPTPSSRTDVRHRDRDDRDDDWFDDDRTPYGRYDDDDTPHGRRRPKRRRESFLGELFDF